MGSGERKWFEIPDEFQEHLSSLQQQLIKEAVKNQEVVAETGEKISQPVRNRRLLRVTCRAKTPPANNQATPKEKEQESGGED